MYSWKCVKEHLKYTSVHLILLSTLLFQKSNVTCFQVKQDIIVILGCSRDISSHFRGEAATLMRNYKKILEYCALTNRSQIRLIELFDFRLTYGVCTTG